LAIALNIIPTLYEGCIVSVHRMVMENRPVDPGSSQGSHRPISFIRIKESNGQNRVHPEAQWPKPGTPFHASPRAPSYWPTPAQTRLWPNFKRVHPILATHPPHRLPDFNHTYPIMAGLFVRSSYF